MPPPRLGDSKAGLAPVDSAAPMPLPGAAAKDAPGFRGTRLHRSLDPDAPYPVVNVARWDSVEDWQAVFGKYFSRPRRRDDSAQAKGGWDAVSAHPALYSVVHVTPDPGAQS